MGQQEGLVSTFQQNMPSIHPRELMVVPRQEPAVAVQQPLVEMGRQGLVSIRKRGPVQMGWPRQVLDWRDFVLVGHWELVLVRPQERGWQLCWLARPELELAKVK